MKVKKISKERDSLRNDINEKVSATEFTNIQNYVSRKIENLFREIRYRYEIMFMLLKAISKIEDSAEENAKKYNKQLKKKWAEQQQILIIEAKQNCPICF